MELTVKRARAKIYTILEIEIFSRIIALFGLMMIII